MLSIGLVVLNYNDHIRTTNLVKKAEEINIIDFIVVVDNCSTDNSFDELKKMESTKCRVILSDKNGGYAYGNNFGSKYLIKNFNVDIVLISNPDVIINEKLINSIKWGFETSDYSLLTGMMNNINGEISSKAYWKETSFLYDVLDCTYIGRKISKRYNYKGLVFNENICEVDVVPGSFFGIRARDLQEIGYLDERTFLYYEEDILSKKLKRKNMKVGLLTSESFIHSHIPSITNIKSILRYLKSKWYYQIEYNNLNLTKKIILITAIIYSILETAVSNPIKEIILQKKGE